MKRFTRRFYLLTTVCYGFILLGEGKEAPIDQGLGMCGWNQLSWSSQFLTSDLAVWET